jgi:uncharacterized protein (TIGR00255 family)
MMSMTGFGRGRCEVAGRRFVVEIRSVNHRFLELKTKLPWSDPLVEQQTTTAVKRRIGRGAITLSVRPEGGGGGASGGVDVTADLPLARAYARALVELSDACELQERPSLALIAAQPGVLTSGADRAAGDELWTHLAPGVEAALDELTASRAREGAALQADLLARLVHLRAIVDEVARLAEGAPSDARRRLEERLRKLLGGEGGAAPDAPIHVDPQRLALEVAIIADRADITEETTRFATHVDEAERLLRGGEPAGRRLDFLAQELHREVNTMGSKSQRADLAAKVIEAKAEVERLREQVQNLE